MHYRLSRSAVPAHVCLILSFSFLGGAITPTPAWGSRGAFSPDGKQLYLPDPFVPGIDVVDTATSKIVSTIPFRNAGWAGALAISHDGAQLYAADSSYDQLVIISTTLSKVVARVKVGVSPIALGVSPDAGPDGGRVYVLNSSSHNVSVVDPKADQVVATIPVASRPGDLVVQPNGNRVYVSITGDPHTFATRPLSSGQVVVIDTTTHQTIKTLHVQSGPSALAISRDGRRLYVTHADPASSLVDVVETASLASEPAIPGGYASAATISPDADRLYILSSAFDLVAAIDTTHGQVVGVSPPVVEPRSLWASPDGRRLYLEDSSRTISVIDAVTLQPIATIKPARVPTKGN